MDQVVLWKNWGEGVGGIHSKQDNPSKGGIFWGYILVDQCISQVWSVGYGDEVLNTVNLTSKGGDHLARSTQPVVCAGTGAALGEEMVLLLEVIAV